MQEIKLTFNKNFIMAMKSNRLVALSYEDKHQGRFVNINSLNLELLKLKHHTNHFALKTKLYLKAVQPSFLELRKLSA